MTFGSVFGRTFSPTFQPKSQAASSSAWSPTDITGCLLWYDFSDADTLFTDAGSTKVANDGDAIYQANDKSGNSHHAIQATSTKRPFYKTNIQNSMSVSLFDGSDDWLGIDLGANAPANFTYMAVAKHVGVTSASYESSFHMGEAPGTRQIFESTMMKSNTSNKFGTYADDYTTTISDVSSAFYTITHLFNSSNHMDTYQNGTKKGIGRNAGGAFAGDQYAGIGAYRYLTTNVQSWANVYFGEIVLYNSGLSDTDRGTVETYLNNKWAIY